jgi:PKD repeat protein
MKDTVGPTSVIVVPTSGGYYNSLSNITGTATDSGGSGVFKVNLTVYNATGHTYWTGTAWQTSSANLTATGTTSWYRAALPTWTNGTTYIINGTAIDILGSIGTTHSHTFYYDTCSPVLSSISSGTPTTTSATITWTTNENATGNVTYGTTTSYGSYSYYSAYVTSHDVPLTGLSSSTTYHYKIISVDHAGNTVNSTDHTFTTASSGGGGGGSGGGNPPSDPTPVAQAGDPYTGYINVLITFDGSSSTETDGEITGYRWDWTNDGTYDTSWSTSATATHAYTNAGSYTVKLQVKDDNNVTATDTTTVTITTHPGTTVSQDLLSTIQTEYGVSLTNPFYANDTNGDGVVDTFTDPNHILTVVHFASISDNAAFLISTNEDNIPEFFWDTTTNTVTPLHHSLGSVIDTVDNTNAKTITITISVEKTNWIYIEITDQYPDNPDVIVKTVDGRTISSEMIWRENGKIFILDDPATEYLIVYSYLAGSLFDVTVELTPNSVHVGIDISALITLINVGEPGLVNGTVNYTLYKGEEIVWSSEEVVSVLSQKVFTKTISTTGLSLGSYTYKVTYSYTGGQTASAQGVFTVDVVQQPLLENILLWVIVIIIIIIIIVIAVLFKLGYLYFGNKEK